MFREVWATFVRKFIEKHVVAEVPDEMAACLDCDAVQCLDGVYETCPNRLGRAAALSAARAPAAGRPITASNTQPTAASAVHRE